MIEGILYLFNKILILMCNLYTFLLKIFYFLDSDIRRDIFIGITGLMVAIVIFIAEVVSKQKHELDKRVVLEKTSIIKNIKFCVGIFLLMLVFSLIKSSFSLCDSTSQNVCFQSDWLFFLFQLILNVLIVIFMYKTVCMFIVAVKLNVNKGYFNRERDEYVYKHTIEIEKSFNDKNKLKKIEKAQKKFDYYISDKKIFSTDILPPLHSPDDYVVIYSNKNGVIKNYDYKKINALIDSYDNILNRELQEYIDSKDPCLIFLGKIGSKVTKSTPLAYCLKKYNRIFNELANCIIYDEKEMYVEDEINLVTASLFEISKKYNAPHDYDDNNMIFNYFNHLYKYNLVSIKQVALEQLEEVYREVYSDYYKNNSYSKFLSRLTNLSYNFDIYEDYQKINDLIYFLYCQQLLIEGIDVKLVAYNFSNNFFKFNYFLVKKNKNVKYYDDLMSCLFKFMCKLMRMKRFDAVVIIFKNVIFEHFNYNGETLNSYEIINFQFACGIIYCLMLIDNKDDLTSDDKEDIKLVIDEVRKNFIDIYDAWEAILCFRNYFNSPSCVQESYSNFEFDCIDNKYLSSYVSYCTDEKIILKELLYSFNISFMIKENVNFDKVTKDDRFYYEQLLEVMDSSSNISLNKVLDKNFDQTNIIETLKLIVDDANKKEQEYFRKNKLNAEKRASFEKIIRFEIAKTDDFVSYLKENKKIKNSSKSLKKVCGINQLIPRKLFFDDYGGLDNIAKDFGSVFWRKIKQEYIKKIDMFSKTINKENMDEMLSKIENLNNYVLITNFLNFKHLGKYKAVNGGIMIKNNKINVLKISGVEGIYLIEKKYLPIINYCQFDESFDKEHIKGHIFYELVDCSKEECVRNELIEKTSWLAEKGDIVEQHKYLMQQCLVKIYLAYKINIVKNSTAIKFNVDEITNY